VRTEALLQRPGLSRYQAYDYDNHWPLQKSVVHHLPAQTLQTRALLHARSTNLAKTVAAPIEVARARRPLGNHRLPRRNGIQRRDETLFFLHRFVRPREILWADSRGSPIGRLDAGPARPARRQSARRSLCRLPRESREFAPNCNLRRWPGT